MTALAAGTKASIYLATGPITTHRIIPKLIYPRDERSGIFRGASRIGVPGPPSGTKRHADDILNGKLY